MLSPEEQQALDLLLKKKNSTVAPTLKSVRFTNWTEEDFTHTWDRVPYTVKAHETIVLQDWLASHLAKHLAERELNRENQGIKREDQKDTFFTPKKQEFINRALGTVVSEANTSNELEIQMMNPEPKIEDKPAKEVFEGLDEATTKKGK